MLEAPLETPTASGRGVRSLPVGTVRHLLRLGAWLYAVCGLAILHVGLAVSGAVEEPGAYLAVATAVVTAGLVALVVEHLASDEVIQRLYAPIAFTLVFGAVVLVSLELHLAGVHRWNVGSCVYLIGPIFGFYVFERAVAGAVVVAVAVGYGLVLAAGDVPAPVSQWLFLLAMVVATARLVQSLVTRADGMAARADTARRSLAEINETLEARVAEKVDEVERLSRLRHFLSPQIANAVLSAGGDEVLTPHRRLIAVLFCDLRGFTRFAARAEPEEVVELIQIYRDEVVAVLDEHDATIGLFEGDGVMAYFGDPVPVDDPVRTAVDAALALEASLDQLREGWWASGFDLGWGIGIAYGHATLGTIRSRDRCDYTPIGSVVNLASRLCGEARDGEILLDRRANAALRDGAVGEPRLLEIKGFEAPLPAFPASAGSASMEEGDSSTLAPVSFRAERTVLRPV